jgi:uncharacterized membrane protein
MIRHNLRHWRKRACLATAAFGFVGAEPGSAQDDGLVTIDARRCAEIESRDERLACFEAQVDQAAKKPATPPAATTTSGSAQAAGSAAPPATPQVDAARVPPQQSQDASDQTAEWVGSITTLQQRIPYRYLITLDTGQVWEQALNERYALRVGQRVRVYKSRWGSHYRLEAEGLNGFIQVELVR